jgi:hypothetical protein
MQNIKINRDFSHYQTLQGHKAKVNGFSAISQSPLSLVRSQPIFIKPYSTKPLAIEGHSKVSILTLDLETRTLLNGQLEGIQRIKEAIKIITTFLKQVAKR